MSIKGKLSAGRPSSKARPQTLSSMSDETVRVNFDLDRDEHMKLKVYAAKRRKSVKDVLTEYVVGLPRE